MKLNFSKCKQKIAVATISCMVCTLIPSPVFAVQFSDVTDHWAQNVIQSKIDKGVVKGYEDGTFHPNGKVTRAEFMKMINTEFGYRESAPISYSDVIGDKWYVNEIEKAKAAGYISGYPDNTMRPNNPITREEAATILIKTNKIEVKDIGQVGFSDESMLKWSKGAVAAAVAAKIMNGYPDGSFRPQNFISRAESVVAIDKSHAYKEANVGMVTPPIIATPAPIVTPPGVKPSGGHGHSGGGSSAVTPAVTSVTVTPATATVTKGGIQQLAAAVAVLGGAAQSVTWSSNNAKVTVSAIGMVTVEADAPAGNYTITATSTVDGTKTGTSTIIVLPIMIMASIPAGAYMIPTGVTDNAISPAIGGYEMATTETTFELWNEVRDWAIQPANGGYVMAERTGSPEYPVTNINWYDTIVWLNAYSQMKDLPPVYRTTNTLGGVVITSSAIACANPTAIFQTENKGYRLPTSMEWELAARWIGTTAPTIEPLSAGAIKTTVGSTTYYWTPGSYASGATGYFNDATTTIKTGAVAVYDVFVKAPVGSKNPNALGLKDMSGNVEEWCFNFYNSGSSRVIRGGACYDDVDHMRVGVVDYGNPDSPSSFIGFRFVRTL